MKRSLLIDTDGEQITVAQCELTPLELDAVFRILSGALRAGQFPFPGNKAPTLLVLREPAETKPAEAGS